MPQGGWKRPESEADVGDVDESNNEDVIDLSRRIQKTLRKDDRTSGAQTSTNGMGISKVLEKMTYCLTKSLSHLSRGLHFLLTGQIQNLENVLTSSEVF